MRPAVLPSPGAAPIPTTLTGKKALGGTGAKAKVSMEHVGTHTSAALIQTAWANTKKVEDTNYDSQASTTDAEAQAHRTGAKALAAAVAANKRSNGKDRGARDMDGVAQLVAIPPLAALSDGCSEHVLRASTAASGGGIDAATAVRVQSALAAMSMEGEGGHRKDVIVRDLDDIAPMMCPTDVEPMSIGSVMHQSNTCKPCIFWTRGVCTLGRLCKYCHHLHTGDARYTVQRRARARARQQALENVPAGAPQFMVWSGKDWQSKLVINL